MNTILTVEFMDLKHIEQVYTGVYSPEIAQRCVEWPSPLTVRHVVRGKSTVRYTFTPNFRKDYVDVVYELEGSAVLSSGFVQSFRFRFRGASDLSKSDNPILVTPDDPRIDQWMRQPDSNLQGSSSSHYRFLQILYFMCSTIVAYFPCGLNVKTESGDERYLTVKPDILDVVTAYEAKLRVDHMYDGWDLVSLSDEDYRQLHWYVYTVKEKETKEFTNSFVNIPLPAFAFRVRHKTGLTTVYYYSVEGDRLHVTVSNEHPDQTSAGGRGICFDAVSRTHLEEGRLVASVELVEEGLSKDKLNWLYAPVSEDGKYKNTFEFVIHDFFLVNDFLRLPVSDLNLDVEERTCSPLFTNRHRSKPDGRNVVRLFRTYRLNRDGFTAPRKQPVYTCSAWGVKGHYRHLKDGRTVFVNAYVKGKEKNKYVGKEYLIRSPL